MSKSFKKFLENNLAKVGIGIAAVVFVVAVIAVNTQQDEYAGLDATLSGDSSATIGKPDIQVSLTSPSAKEDGSTNYILGDKIEVAFEFSGTDFQTSKDERAKKTKRTKDTKETLDLNSVRLVLNATPGKSGGLIGIGNKSNLICNNNSCKGTFEIPKWLFKKKVVQNKTDNTYRLAAVWLTPRPKPSPYRYYWHVGKSDIFTITQVADTGEEPAPKTATLGITTNPVIGEIYVNGDSIGAPSTAGDYIATTINPAVENKVEWSSAGVGWMAPDIVIIPANTVPVSRSKAMEGVYTQIYENTSSLLISATDLNIDTSEISVGDILQLKAELVSADQTVITDVTGDVTWSFGSPVVVSVDLSGLLTAVAPGTGNVTATYETGADVATTGDITVQVVGEAVAEPGTLEVTADSSISGTTYAVKGSRNVPGLGIKLTAGPSDITVKKLDIIVTSSPDPVESVILYDGADVMAGPESIGNGGTIQFNYLDINVPANESYVLTAKVNIRNTSAEGPISLDLIPHMGVIAEDANSNAVILSNVGKINNGKTGIIVIPAGELSIYSEGNPDADILIAGSTRNFVSKYRFHAREEGFDVNKLTITNDLNGIFDQSESTFAVREITIKYTDINGVTQEKSASLESGGKATISGLDMYVPENEDTYLEIYTDINTKAATTEAISGQEIRLGLLTDGLEAVGHKSSTTINAPEIVNGASVNGFVVRTTKPTFAKAPGTRSLINGENTLYGATITADNAGSVGLAKLTYDYAITGNTEIGECQFYRGSSMLYDITIAKESSRLVVNFQEEETVSAGASQTFYLKCVVSGARTNDTISTRLHLDETGQSGSIDALSGNGIIWSDKSADMHSTTTSDWTNGYMLKTAELTANTLMY